jgi:predicted metalloenzyme YecM
VFPHKEVNLSNKIKINFGGEEVEALPMDINQTNEYWNQYLLDDGTVIKMKLVATKVLRVDNKYDQEGNPLYIIQSTNVTSVNALDNLKKKG